MDTKNGATAEAIGWNFIAFSEVHRFGTDTMDASPLHVHAIGFRLISQRAGPPEKWFGSLRQLMLTLSAFTDEGKTQLQRSHCTRRGHRYSTGGRRQKLRRISDDFGQG